MGKELNMQINKYDGTSKDWTLFSRKRGQQDWEWKELGSNILNADGLINMSKFYESEGYTVFDSADDFIEFEVGDDFFTGLLKNGDYFKAKEHLDFVVEKCEYFDKYMDEDHLIILHDASGSVDVVPKFSDRVTEDATEYIVGIPKN